MSVTIWSGSEAEFQQLKTRNMMGFDVKIVFEPLYKGLFGLVGIEEN